MRKLLLASFIAFAAFAANAAYLYWQVDDPAITTYNTTLPSPATSDSAYAGEGVYFKLRDSAGNYYDGDSDKTTVGVGGTVSGGIASPNQSYYSTGVDSGFSYYVEMYNSAHWLIARSASINSSSGDWTAGYADSIRTTDLSNIPSMEIWHVGGFVAVPEPTSAMLMLFGAAFLGLKRKNRRIA